MPRHRSSTAHRMLRCVEVIRSTISAAKRSSTGVGHVSGGCVDADVIIVGAGPTGLMLANEPRTAGHSGHRSRSRRAHQVSARRRMMPRRPPSTGRRT
ncbi:FAD-dependent monooxygenase [Streptomyces sp. NPDC059349]|uniref:FAD-dependent monooxygenase n=1 Tax=Streptomyces sp. NPDC059349 TaxID=3346808 RepID=UPI003675F421